MNESKYYWQGKDQKGRAARGIIQATKPTMAKITLYKQGIIVTTIKPYSFHKRSIRPKDKTFLIRQIAISMQAGSSFLQALEFISKQKNSLHIQFLIETIKRNIEIGNSIKESFQYAFFDPLLCNLLQVGEQTGQIESVFSMLATHREKIEALQKKLRKAFIYPSFLLSFALVITSLLLLFVLPQLQHFYQDFGAELPFLTTLLLSSSHFLQTNGLFFLLFILSIGSIFLYLKPRSPHFYKLQTILISKIPLLGSLQQYIFLARFSRTLYLTLYAGLPLLTSLDLAKEQTRHRLYQEYIASIKEAVAQGVPLAESLQKWSVFPLMMTQMLCLGEASGTVEEMLLKLAHFYEQEVDNLLVLCSTMLEPLLLSLLGVFIGGLILAMYLPIFQLGSVL